VAEHIKADLEAVGVTATLRPRPFEEYGQFIVSGGQEMFRYGWVGAYPSLDAYLGPLFATGSAENLSGLSDPDVDAGLTAARAETDPQTRAEIYQRVEQEVLSQFAVVLIGELETRLALAERVESFALNPLGTFDGAAVTLTPTDE
jgi:oligopeptide transport system substrate-binding protein